MNESTAYNSRKLKCSGLIHGCFSKDGIDRIKHQAKDRPVKIFHIDTLHGFFPDFDFGDANDKDDIFLDASKVVTDSVQSSYYFAVCSKSKFFHKSNHMHIMCLKS